MVDHIHRASLTPTPAKSSSRLRAALNSAVRTEWDIALTDRSFSSRISFLNSAQLPVARGAGQSTHR